MRMNKKTSQTVITVAALVTLCLIPILSRTTPFPGVVWFKGNLHTHTLWSDGDAPPEVTVGWYKNHGYDFLALSDHNILSAGEKWIPVLNEGKPDNWPPPFTTAKLNNLKQQFGENSVELRSENDSLFMRLRTLEELREQFQQASRFILIQAEEITDTFEKYPVHVNATNLETLIMPQGGGSTSDVMQRNIDAVRAQRDETGRPMIAHINHPNFGWGIVAEDLIRLNGDRFFEIYNGHPGVRNWGDESHPGTDRMWDIVLAMRLAQGREPLYGVAVDDAHSYYEIGVGESNAGRGWVMVKAPQLSAEALIEAMERGNFYATTGVQLEDVAVSDGMIKITIQADEGVSYRTQFIGTPREFDRSSRPVSNADGTPQHISRIYSSDIGQVLFETEVNPAVYRFSGDELYVRAKIVSDRKHPNPFAEGDVETAWTQPVTVSPSQ